MSKTKTVRVNLDTVPKMDMARSPGESDGELIDRAISLLAEMKELCRKFNESEAYQAWLARQKERREGE